MKQMDKCRELLRPRPGANTAFRLRPFWSAGARSICEKVPRVTTKGVRRSLRDRGRWDANPLKIGLEFSEAVVFNGLG